MYKKTRIITLVLSSLLSTLSFIPILNASKTTITNIAGYSNIKYDYEFVDCTSDSSFPSSCMACYYPGNDCDSYSGCGACWLY